MIIPPHHDIDRYIARGWHVVPLHHATAFGARTGPDRALCSCADPGCDRQGKHPRPRRGSRDATADPDTIRRWWADHPEAGVGIATGHPGGPDVIDLDSDDALALLVDQLPAGHGLLDGPIVRTARGLHLYVASPGNLPNRAPITGWPGIDYRGRGGYVVAPPSMHHTGVPYRWCDGHGPDRPLPEVPGWWRERIARTPPPPPVPPEQVPVVGRGYGDRALAGEVARLLATPVGRRNAQLNASAYTLGRLVASGYLHRGVVEATLQAAGQRMGLGDTEVRATVSSGLDASADHPRYPAGRAS